MTVSTIVSSWTPTITRGGVYVVPIAFTDEDGNPETLASASFDVEPNGAAPFSWTQGNGKFVNTSAGVYTITLDEVDTAALSWDSGTYRVSIVDLAGDPDPCVIEGLIFIVDC